MRRSIRRPSPALVVACVALLAALGGTSYATVLNVPKNSVGTPQLQRNAVKAAKVAPSAIRTGHVLNGSLLVEDFKAGQIPQGPKGDKGDKGDTGEPGVSGYQIVTATNAVNNATTNTATAPCPAGKRALGGGSGTSFVNVANGPFVYASRPSPQGSGWSVSMASAVATSWTTTAYAICATVP